MALHDRYGDCGPAPLDDPWYDVLASGWHPPESSPYGSRTVPSGEGEERVAADGHVARTEMAVPQVAGRCARCAFPVGVAFLLWYAAYVVTAGTAPGLLAHPVAGPLNVAMLAGVAQCVSTVVLVRRCWRAHHR